MDITRKIAIVDFAFSFIMLDVLTILAAMMVRKEYVPKAVDNCDAPTRATGKEERSA